MCPGSMTRVHGLWTSTNTLARHVSSTRFARRCSECPPASTVGGVVDVTRPEAAGGGNGGTANNGTVGREQRRREKARKEKRGRQGKEEGGRHKCDGEGEGDAGLDTNDTCCPLRPPRKLKRGPSRAQAEIVAGLHAVVLAAGGASCSVAAVAASPGTSGGGGGSGDGVGLGIKGKASVYRGDGSAAREGMSGAAAGTAGSGAGTGTGTGAVGKRSSVRLRAGAAGPVDAAMAAASAAERQKEAEEKSESEEDDDDEICRELKAVWKQLIVHDSRALCQLAELEGKYEQPASRALGGYGRYCVFCMGETGTARRMGALCCSGTVVERMRVRCFLLSKMWFWLRVAAVQMCRCCFFMRIVGRVYSAPPSAHTAAVVIGCKRVFCGWDFCQ